ncbi:MAG: 50S ribosomal protein L11 methyltransferase [Anaerolineae bacterium]|nr:50S ribosomal protein L11 methyltransferase [Anaerolineae bacterium]
MQEEGEKMNWLEVSLVVDGEAAEAVADLFQQYAHQGVVIETAAPDLDAWPDELEEKLKGQALVVRAYLPPGAATEDARARIEQGLWYLSRLYPMPHQPTYRTVEEADWAEAWKVHYKPVRVGRRILIRPRWEAVAAAPGDVVIALDPGMAFGTGTHPSTQLCLAALEDYVKPGDAVLDLGTGSGILAIAAVKLGAREALALDVDDVAVRVAGENARENGVGGMVTVQRGSLEAAQATGRVWDVAAVNILAKVIIAFCGAGLGDVVKPGGVLVAAGVIEEQAAEVAAALAGAGLAVVETRMIGDWVALVCRRGA